MKHRRRWAVVLAANLTASLTLAALASGRTHYETSTSVVFPVLVSLSFCVAGLVAGSRSPNNRVGPLLIAVSFAFVVGSLELTSVPVLFSIGLLLDLFWIGLLIHVLAVFPSGHFDSIWGRMFAATGWLATVVIQLARDLVNDPAVSDGCTTCPENLFAVSPNSTVFDTLSFVQGPVLGLVALVLGVMNIATKWRRSTVVTRRALLPPLVAGTTAFVLLMVSWALEDRNDMSSLASELAAGVAVLAIPISMAVGVVQLRLSHNRVGGLALRLGSRAVYSDELEKALAWSVDDPTLQVAYWAPQLGHYLDADGSRVEESAGADRSSHVIEQDGQKVAILFYDPTLDELPGLIDAVAATAGLALENERLRAELRAQVVSLRESRSRLMTAEHAERQRLERNLHDGAQQRLLGLGLSLQLLHSKLNDAAPETVELVDEAEVEVREAIRELRDLAHGLHPAVLAESGLKSAIEALTTRTPFRVDLDYNAADSYGTSVDAGAYYVISEAITNATKHANPLRGQVKVEQRADQLIISVIDDGVGGADPGGAGLTGLSDRVAALGGVLKVHSPPGLGTSIVVKLPCES